MKHATTIVTALCAATGLAYAGGFSLTNDNAILSIDDGGWSTGLVERATGRVLANGRVPFVRPQVKGKYLVSTAVEQRGPDEWAWKYGNLPGEIVVGVKPFVEDPKTAERRMKALLAMAEAEKEQAKMVLSSYDLSDKKYIEPLLAELK